MSIDYNIEELKGAVFKVQGVTLRVLDCNLYFIKQGNRHHGRYTLACVNDDDTLISTSEGQRMVRGVLETLTKQLNRAQDALLDVLQIDLTEEARNKWAEKHNPTLEAAIDSRPNAKQRPKRKLRNFPSCQTK